MKTRELFKRRVIELIHGLPYEEAIIKECRTCDSFGFHVVKGHDTKPAINKGHKHEINPITIGRVMQTLGSSYSFLGNGSIVKTYDDWNTLLDWKLTKENGSEATDDDQTDETIEKLYNLIK